MINEPNSPPDDEWSQITSDISPFFDPRTSAAMNLMLPVLLTMDVPKIVRDFRTLVSPLSCV
jgi:hypothetical protein